MTLKARLKNWGVLLLTVLFIILSVLNFFRINSVSHSVSDTLRPFIIQTSILFLLFLLFYLSAFKRKLNFKFLKIRTKIHSQLLNQVLTRSNQVYFP
jgi:hypothetical protein